MKYCSHYIKKCDILLIQELYPENLIGKKLGEGIHGGIYNGNLEDYKQTVEGQKDLLNFKSILERIPKEIDIVIISEHRGNKLDLDLLQNKADENDQIIITRFGYYDRGNGFGIRNSVAVFVPNREKIMVDKIAFTAEDYELDIGNELKRGECINIINSSFGKIALLNCFDYTHIDLINMIADKNIDILIISAFNPATRLFNEYAIADMHRLFCFVIISNIANYGGSGVYAPFRRIGPKLHGVTLGGVLSYEKGPNVSYTKVSLDLNGLNMIRDVLKEKGSIEYKKRKLENYLPPILPAETFLDKSENSYKNIINSNTFLETIDLKEIGYENPLKQKKYGSLQYKQNLNVGVAHLKGMEIDDYLYNNYHISSSKKIDIFTNYIVDHLDRLSKQLKDTGEKLDFLIFPEVFMPLGLLGKIEEFSKNNNTIVIFGVEYEEQNPKPKVLEDACGSNRCFIYIPTKNGEIKQHEYVKLTRSQYDARTPRKREGDMGHFKMKLGTKIIRFKHPDYGQFGVLICYDYSHLDILQKINRYKSDFPPEILFVPAYNPDSSLYESCCLADCHRYYQYIVMSNVAQYGGSGVFGPLKRDGTRQTLMKAGVGVEGISIVSIDIKTLRDIRNNIYTMKKNDYQKKPGLFDYFVSDDG